MDTTNEKVLKELQEYAQLYFEAIVEANTENGKCILKPGKYSAKDFQDNSHKSVFGHSYPLPDDSIFDENITVKCGTFECEFPYRRIFVILARWEAMCKPGKMKTVFEIGEFEEKSVKVLINERTILGAFKRKTMRLQRINGNWWGLPKEIRKEREITAYYELNGVMFAPGKSFWGDPREGSNKAFTDKFDDARMIALINTYLANEDNKKYPAYDYYAEVARCTGIDAPTATETPRISTEAAKVESEPTGEANDPVKHISEIMETCRTWDDEKRDYADEYKYYTWLANHIPEHKDTNKNTTALILEEVRERISAAATLAAHGVPKCDIEGAVCAVVKRLAKMEDILQLYEPKEHPKGERRLWDRTRKHLRDCRPVKHLRRPTLARAYKGISDPRFAQRRHATPYHFADIRKMVGHPPRFDAWRDNMQDHSAGICKMILSPPGHTPPIRGDCKLNVSARTEMDSTNHP